MELFFVHLGLKVFFVDLKVSLTNGLRHRVIQKKNHWPVLGSEINFLALNPFEIEFLAFFLQLFMTRTTGSLFYCALAKLFIFFSICLC